MFSFNDTDYFVQERIQQFHAEADAQRKRKAIRRSAPAPSQPQVIATIVRFAQVALTLGR